MRAFSGPAELAVISDLVPEIGKLAIRGWFRPAPIAQVPGGHLALGRLDASAHTGPVIWLSPDGQAWQWLPLPVNRPDAWALAPAVGSDVLMLSSSSTGSQAWRIPDVAAVIASIPVAS